MFKQRFKYFKRKTPEPDFSAVIDLDNRNNAVKLSRVDLCSKLETEFLPGLKPVSEWLCCTLDSTGIIIIRNPFTVHGQRYWVSRCLQDYPLLPNVTNLSPHLFSGAVLNNWWQYMQKCSDPGEVRRLSISMRWATLGYHHDWDSKVYSEKKRSVFPKDLAALIRLFANVLGFEDYKAEAAIVNFYPIGATLSPHTDHSEPNRTAPLFSLSFGQTAIFLIGGKSKEDKPLAFYLRSGDVLVMSGISRLCYHAVPRVMKTHQEPWNELIPVECRKYLDSPNCKTSRMEPENTWGIDTLLYQQVADEIFWAPFKKYLNSARININVRQVLNSDETRLPMQAPVSARDLEYVDATYSNEAK